MVKLSPSGIGELKFDSSRVIEQPNDDDLNNISKRSRQLRELFLAPDQPEVNCDLEQDSKSCHCIIKEFDGIVGKPGPNNKIKKGAIFCIEPSGYTKPEKLQFTYEFGDFEDKSVSLSLNFADPDNVSIAKETDILVIELKDFRDNEGNLIVDEKTIRISIPNQVEAGLAVTVEAAGSTAASGVASSFSFNFIMSILLSSSLSKMLASIKNLQIIVHLSLLGIAMPGLASIFFASIQSMIAFDPLPNADAYIVDVFQIEEEDSIEIEGNFP